MSERLRLVWGWAFFWLHLDFILWLNSSQTTIAHVIHALQCLIEFYSAYTLSQFGKNRRRPVVRPKIPVVKFSFHDQDPALSSPYSSI
ncbi:hypothetical protein C8J56DRAFT_122749 [Mycena floridula]|nr:hypothetical protein C8J56DRAFT_122749 [Mycena floridula]